jgi:hypothetical protein
MSYRGMSLKISMTLMSDSEQHVGRRADLRCRAASWDGSPQSRHSISDNLHRLISFTWLTRKQLMGVSINVRLGEYRVI